MRSVVAGAVGLLRIEWAIRSRRKRFSLQIQVYLSQRSICFLPGLIAGTYSSLPVLIGRTLPILSSNPSKCFSISLRRMTFLPAPNMLQQFQQYHYHSQVAVSSRMQSRYFREALDNPSVDFNAFLISLLNLGGFLQSLRMATRMAIFLSLSWPRGVILMLIANIYVACSDEVTLALTSLMKISGWTKFSSWELYFLLRVYALIPNRAATARIISPHCHQTSSNIQILSNQTQPICLHYIFVTMLDQRDRDHMRVVVRVRPLARKEQEEIENYEEFWEGKKKSSRGRLTPTALSFYSKYHNAKPSQVIKTVGSCVSVYDQQYKNTEKRMRDYTFSDVFEPGKSNSDIFQHCVRDSVAGVLEGFNCTVLAYGITGSGKTFSVFGHPRQEKQRGLCHLTFEYLLGRKQELELSGSKVELKFSFLEIYNQNIRDLLSEDGKKQVLISQDGKGNTLLGEANEVSIKTIEQVVQLISSGTTRRSSAATQYNQISSRSHAVLKMSIEINKQGQKISSKLFIIDLAGSEKIHLENNVRKTEGSNINRSLLSLGNCINALVENEKKSGGHIPYRDSKLTRILKDSLGGNAKTIMIACISPHPFTLEQTITTLNYAERAQGIKKDITRNITNSEQPCPRCQNQLNFKAIPQHEPSPFEFDITPIQTEHSSEMNSIFSEMFERIYNDVIDNAKESEKIAKLKYIIQEPTQEYQNICKDNEEQRIILKNLLLNLFKQRVKNRQRTQGETERQDLEPSKVTKKKIRLSNSSRKQSKQGKENMKTEFESQQKPFYRKSEELVIQGMHTPIHSPQISKQADSKVKLQDKSQERRESIVSQKKKRSKFEIVKRPPLYEQKRSSSEQKPLTQCKESNQQ